MSETYKCPRCGVKTFFEHSQPFMIPQLIRVNNGNGIATDTQHGIGVKALICTTCKHIEFKAILGNDDLEF